MDWIAAAVTAEGLRCQTSFDDIKNEMINNECGDVYRRVVLLMLSVA